MMTHTITHELAHITHPREAAHIDARMKFLEVEGGVYPPMSGYGSCDNQTPPNFYTNFKKLNVCVN